MIRGNSDNLPAGLAQIKIELGEQGVTTMAGSQWTACHQPRRAWRCDGFIRAAGRRRLFAGDRVPL